MRDTGVTSPGAYAPAADHIGVEAGVTHKPPAAGTDVVEYLHANMSRDRNAPVRLARC